MRSLPLVRLIHHDSIMQQLLVDVRRDLGGIDLGPELEQLLEIVKRNRAWNEEAARKQLIKFFEAWGPTDPLTLDARRRLSTLLFA